MSLGKNNIFWRTVGVDSNMCTGLGSNLAALARSKALNHYPVVAAYFWHVQCAGCSTGLPPSIEVAEQ